MVRQAGRGVAPSSHRDDAPTPVSGAATRRVFIRASWVPLALWVGTLLYLRRLEGWGAWAAAPLLLPSFALSLWWGCLGVVLLGRAVLRDRRADFPVLAATLVSGAAALYYILRYLVRSVN